MEEQQNEITLENFIEDTRNLLNVLNNRITLLVNIINDLSDENIRLKNELKDKEEQNV